MFGGIPLDPALMKACEQGLQLAEFDADAPAVGALDTIAERLIEVLNSA